MNIGSTQVAPQYTRWHWGGGLGCHKFKSVGKLSNDWTDWPQHWHTSADPSGNGYTPNKLSLETLRGALGVLGGQTLKSMGSCQTAGPIGTALTLIHVCGFIWEWTHAKSKSPLNTPVSISSALLDTRAPWGFLGGHIFKSLEKPSNGWTDWHQLWFTSADSSGYGHWLNTSRTTIPQGAFGGGGV